MDDYYIFDELTVYFGNGKVKVDPKYNPEPLALTTKAKAIEGYMIEVKGYASSTGSAALNQKLSEDRANAVTNIRTGEQLLQQTQVVHPPAPQGLKAFATPQQAADELIKAAAVYDVPQLMVILGPDGEDLSPLPIQSGTRTTPLHLRRGKRHTYREVDRRSRIGDRHCRSRAMAAAGALGEEEREMVFRCQVRPARSSA